MQIRDTRCLAAFAAFALNEGPPYGGPVRSIFAHLAFRSLTSQALMGLLVNSLLSLSALDLFYTTSNLKTTLQARPSASLAVLTC